MIILFDYYFKTDDNMTPNKQFNTYKEGLDLGFLREYCMEHGGTADVRAGRDARGGGQTGAVGGLRGAGMLQVYGASLGAYDVWLVQE